MNDIFVANMALETYLISSLVRISATTMGDPDRRNGMYSSVRSSPTSGRSTPTTTRSGLLKSSIASPSFRNSGLLAMSNDWSVRSAIRRWTSCVVPTGTVLLTITVQGWSIASAISSATPQTARRSAAPSGKGGVPTAMKMRSLPCTAAGRSVVKLRRPAFTPLWYRSSNPNS